MKLSSPVRSTAISGSNASVLNLSTFRIAITILGIYLEIAWRPVQSDVAGRLFDRIIRKERLACSYPRPAVRRQRQPGSRDRSRRHVALARLAPGSMPDTRRLRGQKGEPRQQGRKHRYWQKDQRGDQRGAPQGQPPEVTRARMRKQSDREYVAAASNPNTYGLPCSSLHCCQGNVVVATLPSATMVAVVQMNLDGRQRCPRRRSSGMPDRRRARSPVTGTPLCCWAIR